MSVIIVPTLIKYTELSMLSSKGFTNHGHDLSNIKFRNFSNTLKATPKSFNLPPGITSCGKKKKITARQITTVRISPYIDIDPHGGIEKLKNELSIQLPNEQFYVISLTTVTTAGGERHTCYWRRQPSSASNRRIQSLHLISIDSKNVLDNFSEQEMWKIVGTLPDDKCRLLIKSSDKVSVVCDPVI